MALEYPVLEAQAAVVPVVIANGTSLSVAQNFGEARVIGFIMPSAWDAAHLTFQVSDLIDGTFVNLYNESGTEVDITVAVDRAYSLNTSGAYLTPFNFVKVRSGTAALPVNQTAARTIKF